MSLLLALPAAALGDDTQPQPAPPKLEVLTHRGHDSRWAFVLKKTIARKSPDTTAKAVTRLKLKTEDGTDNLVLALERITDVSGRRWVRVRLPILPNGQTGWVPQESLGGFHHVRTWLRINRRRLRAT